MSRKELKLEDITAIAGGREADAIAYLDELCIKYGVAPGDYRALEGKMTPEEYEHTWYLIGQR